MDDEGLEDINNNKTSHFEMFQVQQFRKDSGVSKT